MMDNGQSTRQYLVNIHKWRSTLALIACSVTLICSVSAIIATIARNIGNGETLSSVFMYFTTLSNMLTTLASSFIFPYAVNGIRKKRFVMPKWLYMVHYSGAICTTLVFIFAMVFILPYNRQFAIGGSNFYLHVICPIEVLISFELIEATYKYSKKDIMICLVPFLIYSIVYIVMVVFVGEANGGWPDIYMVCTFVPVYVSFPAMWVLAAAVALGIKKLSNVLNRKREAQLVSFWKEDADPVEINIEVYGLGRFYGLHGDKNDLSVPLDILESVSKRYRLDADKLYNVYVKGLLHGIKEREQNSRLS
ncbi:MAG: hypothetical protein IKX96_00250 [Firmicutes bacterium]|nr:hypothetical protein [Bacillota bacterium]